MHNGPDRSRICVSSCATCTKQKSLLIFTAEQCDHFYCGYIKFVHSAMCVCVCVCEVTCVFPLVIERINHQQEACSSPWAQKTVEQQDVLRDMFYSPTSQFIFTSALSWCGCQLLPGCPSHCSAFIPECMNQYWTQRAENDATDAEYINEALITDAVKPVLDGLTSNLCKAFGEVFYYFEEKWWAGKRNTDF